MKNLILFAVLSCIPALAQQPVNLIGTHQFTAVCTFSDNKVHPCPANLTWASAVSSVASINTLGMATGLTAGATQISASVGNIKSNSKQVTVFPITGTLIAVQ